MHAPSCNKRLPVSFIHNNYYPGEFGIVYHAEVTLPLKQAVALKTLKGEDIYH